MSGNSPTRGDNALAKSGLNVRYVLGAVLAVVVVVFVAMNRETANVSFIFFTISTALWVALVVAAVLGVAIGFLLGRRGRG